MAAFFLYFISSAFLGKIFQHYFATYFYFSIDIFLIFLVFNSLNFIFNVGLLSSISYGLLMDYFTGLPLGFFVFGYTIIFYFIDLKSFNYSIFNLDLVVNIMFINFLYPIQNYFTKNFHSFKEDY
nr:rod shape-determining protein MreD [Borreliella afzelii]